jgi:hypothetical protein
VPVASIPIESMNSAKAMPTNKQGTHDNEQPKKSIFAIYYDGCLCDFFVIVPN